MKNHAQFHYPDSRMALFLWKIISQQKRNRTVPSIRQQKGLKNDKITQLYLIIIPIEATM
jgi:hypothetical protein